jgi:hypothetical protein
MMLKGNPRFPEPGFVALYSPTTGNQERRKLCRLNFGEMSLEIVMGEYDGKGDY